MRWKPTLVVWLLFVGAFSANCQFSNDERCPNGFFYVENLLSCCEVGNSIYHPGSEKCHITNKQPSNCENPQFVLLSASYVDKDGKAVSEEACCPPDMTYYNAEQCDVPVEETSSDDKETGDGGPPTGIGESCTVDGTDCDHFEADYCLKHPLNQGDYCTLVDCADGTECGDEFACCDCTSQSVLKPAIVACLKNADAELASAFCDCDL